MAEDVKTAKESLLRYEDKKTNCGKKPTRIAYVHLVIGFLNASLPVFRQNISVPAPENTLVIRDAI